MQCRKCKQKFDSGGEAHVIPKGLGGKYAPTSVFCAACDNSLSDLDKALVEQYDVVRLQMGLSGWRDTPRVEFRDLDGDPVTVDGEGRIGRPRPVWKKTLQTDTGVLKDVLFGPPDKLSQMRPWIEKLPGGKQALENMEVGSELPVVTWKQEVGGSEQVRAVAKTLYTFACDHLARKEIGADFSEIEGFMFDGRPSPLCEHETRLEFYRELGDLRNMLDIHFDAKRHTVVGFATFFGSMMYSALLTRDYSGALSHGIRLINDPLDSAANDHFEYLQSYPEIEPRRLVDRSYLPRQAGEPDPVKPCFTRLLKKASRVHAERVIKQTLTDCMAESGFDPSARTPETEAAFRKCWAREYKRRLTPGRPFIVEQPADSESDA
jgi:hypothetical protein